MKQIYLIIFFTNIVNLFPFQGFSQFTCGDTLTDVRDGKKYPTILIGSQCWMAKSLDIGIMLTDSMWPSDNQIIEKYCYNDSSEYCEIWGGLYTWDEMMNYQTYEKARGICPDGWHIPSDDEVKQLEIELGMTPATADISNDWRGTNQGTQMLPGGGSGLDILFAGARTMLNAFMAGGIYGYIYTSTESGNNAWRRCVRTGDSRVGRFNTFPKTYAFSVRCLLGSDTTKIDIPLKNNTLLCHYEDNTIQVFLSDNLMKEKMLTILVFDINGSIVASLSHHNHNGSNRITIAAHGISSGMYFVKIVAGKSVYSSKLIIY